MSFFRSSSKAMLSSSVMMCAFDSISCIKRVITKTKLGNSQNKASMSLSARQELDMEISMNILKRAPHLMCVGLTGLIKFYL